MNIEKMQFGSTNVGDSVFKFKLKNSNSMEAVVTNYGATLISLTISKNNEKIDMVLGYDDLKNYISNPKFFGSTIGPNCNRINNASFILNDIEYNLEQNDNNNNLHSGGKGFHNVVWNYYMSERENYVEFTHFNPDRAQGFPGDLEVKVRYTLTEDNELKLSYEAVSDKDTVVNLTNHSYFNLSGHKSKDATNQQLWINSKYFTPVKDSKAIPTGEIKSVKGTPMDFTIPKKINSQINENYNQLLFCGGYDHNFVIDKKEDGIEKIAELYDETTNIAMEVYSDSEGVQFYAGNFISGGPTGKDNTVYEDRCGICLETQYFPDSINNENFKSPILKAGDKYKSTTIYKFINK